MKRINKWTCLLMAALACSACGSEEMILSQPDNNPDGQNLMVALNIDPKEADAPDTRAGGNDYIPKGYKLRCIVAAYAQGTTITKPIATETKYYGAGTAETGLSSLNMTASLRLQPGISYTIVAWADYVKNTKVPAALYYNAEDLTRISFDGSQTHDATAANTEDAYSSFQTVAIPAAAPSKAISLSLTRPLAKISMLNIVDASGNAFSGTYQIACEGSGKNTMTYNARTGDVSGKTMSSAVFTAGTGFSPYIYVFRGNSTDKLSVWLKKSDKSEYGVSNGGNTPKGRKVEISRVTKNKNVEIKQAANESGIQALKLYDFK